MQQNQPVAWAAITTKNTNDTNSLELTDMVWMSFVV